MKKINNYIQEKLKLNKTIITKYGKTPTEKTLYPNTKKELVSMIDNEIKKNGWKCSLNHIDIKKIHNLGWLFSSQDWGYGFSNFNGDISEWDVSKVKNMTNMFYGSDFNGDISDWNVSNVDDMGFMFYKSKFNNDISDWNVSSVELMMNMFAFSKFNQNISSWKINSTCETSQIFNGCPIKEEYKPKSLQD